MARWFGRVAGVAAMMALFTAGTAFAQEPPERAPDSPVEVMLLGTYHMANPGLDLANVAAEDPTSPRRQAELAALAEALADWKPDRILVEMQRPAPFTIDGYHAFTTADLSKSRNETVQIGYRLAHRLGHKDVYAFDEQPGDGEPDYFPFDTLSAYAEAHGRSDELAAIMAYFQAQAKAMSADQAHQSIAEQLMLHNDPAHDELGQAKGYYALLAIGDGEDQPGAELNAYWYMRNAKMFAKIGLIAKPGEKVLVLVGSGHRYWLDHFVATTPGFVSVDSRPYLARAISSIRRPCAGPARTDSRFRPSRRSVRASSPRHAPGRG